MSVPDSDNWGERYTRRDRNRIAALEKALAEQRAINYALYRLVDSLPNLDDYSQRWQHELMDAIAKSDTTENT